MALDMYIDGRTEQLRQTAIGERYTPSRPSVMRRTGSQNYLRIRAGMYSQFGSSAR
jgi:hypothetical protein